MTIYSFDVVLSQFGASLLFHVQFYMLILYLHADFSGGRSDLLVFPSLEEFVCDRQFVVINTVKGLDIVNKAVDVFLDSLAFSMIQWMLAI